MRRMMYNWAVLTILWYALLGAGWLAWWILDTCGWYRGLGILGTVAAVPLAGLMELAMRKGRLKNGKR